MAAMAAAPGFARGEEDTFRDRLAAWIGRPDVQWWAMSNGFEIGMTVPLSDDTKRQVAEGVIPDTYTKYGAYRPGPDDMRAFRYAYRTMRRYSDWNGVEFGRTQLVSHPPVVVLFCPGGATGPCPGGGQPMELHGTWLPPRYLDAEGSVRLIIDGNRVVSFIEPGSVVAPPSFPEGPPVRRRDGAPVR